jgi:hypothetical protein
MDCDEPSSHEADSCNKLVAKFQTSLAPEYIGTTEFRHVGGWIEMSDYVHTPAIFTTE